MLTQEAKLAAVATTPRSTTLTRNQIEFAGVVVFFFAIAVVFVLALILMVFETGFIPKTKAASPRPPRVTADSGALSFRARS